jgi:hypothetical protein
LTALPFVFYSTHGKVRTLDCGGSTYLGIIGFWAVFRGGKVVLVHTIVADDVVIGVSVLAGPKEPSFLFGEVGSRFKAFHFAFKVQDVVSLFVAKSAIL